MRLNLLSFNIHKGFDAFNNRFNLPFLKNHLRELCPHLVTLQELVGENHLLQKKIPTWPKESQLNYLSEEIWPHQAYGKNAVFSYRHHGNATLSQFPIIGYHNLNISTNRWESRGLLHCQIELHPNLRLHLCNTHLNLLSRSRIRQVDKICKYIEETIPASDPLILCGDFNDWDRKLSQQLQGKENLFEAFEKMTGRPAPTFPNFFPVLCLDRVYFRNLKIEQVQVLKHKPWDEISDHLPVLTQFETS